MFADEGGNAFNANVGALRLDSAYVGAAAAISIANDVLFKAATTTSATTGARVFMTRAQNSAREAGFRFAVRVTVNDGSAMSEKLQTLIRGFLSRVDSTTLKTLIALAVQEVLLINDVVAGRMTRRAAAEATGRNVVTAVAGAAGMAAGAAIGSLMLPGVGTAIGSLIGSGMCAAAVRSYTVLPAWWLRPLMVPAANVPAAGAGATPAFHAAIDGDARSIASTALSDRSSAYASSTSSMVMWNDDDDDAVELSCGPGQFERATSTELPSNADPADDADPLDSSSMPDIATLHALIAGGKKVSDTEVDDMVAAQLSEAAVRETSRANMAEYQRVRATPPISGKNVGQQDVMLVLFQPAPTNARQAQAVGGRLAAAAVADAAHEFGNRQPRAGLLPPASGGFVQPPLPSRAVPSGGGCASSIRLDPLAEKDALQGVDALGRWWLT
jgi:hypothetical protein